LIRKILKTEQFNEIIEVNRIPDEGISYGNLVVVKNNNTPKWLKFKCPCGCGNEYALTLMKNHKPHWRILYNENDSLSVCPSVNISSLDCGAHFWIRDNRVLWVKEAK